MSIERVLGKLPREIGENLVLQLLRRYDGRWYVWYGSSMEHDQWIHQEHDNDLEKALEKMLEWLEKVYFKNKKSKRNKYEIISA